MTVPKMLEFHPPRVRTTDKTIEPGPSKYVMVSAIHRIDAVTETSHRHDYEEGVRALIVCAGKGGEVYRATESAAELVARVEGR